MKPKPLLPLIVIFVISLVANGLQGFLTAAENAAITDIEYLTGDDFVQLHFKIDKMIPIPDVFYPQKDVNTIIMMRMEGVPFALSKDRFIFDSNVINYLEIIRGKDSTVEVMIHLKQQANYRVFTNPKGLFIEFPNLKGESSDIQEKKPVKPTVSAKNDKKEKDYTKPTPPVINAPTTNVSTQPTKVASVSNKPDTSGRIEIQDVSVIESDENHVKFRVTTSSQPDYNIIPIPDTPARLAIDLKNTHSKTIKKPINRLNVKTVRGQLNTASVYRLVFDLQYLKDYTVTPLSDGLEIAFFNSDTGKKEILASNNNEPKPEPVAVEPKPASSTPEIKQKEEAPVTNTSSDKTEPQTVTPKKNNKAEKKNKQAKTESPKPEPEKMEPVKTEEAKPAETLSTPITITNEDFFEDEKSKVQTKDQKPVKEPEKKIDTVVENPNESQAELQETLPQDKIIEGTETRRYKGELMSFRFHNADLKDVIKTIAKMANKNIVLDPGITGRVTSELVNVPWDQALELFLKINGLAYLEDGNIIRIGRVKDLANDTVDRVRLQIIKQFEGEVSVVTRTLSFAKADEVVPLLEPQLSPQGEIMIDKRMNRLIISDIQGKIAIIDKLIETLDSPTLQVSIEARFVETRANSADSLGIQWGYNLFMDPAHGNQTTLKFPSTVSSGGTAATGGYVVNLPAAGAFGSTGFSFGNIANTFSLNLALSALESKGEARVISAPKTTTQNNKEAYIMSGRQIPFQTIQNNTVSVQYKAAALELKVTPQITAKDTIICDLEVNNNSADFANEVTGVGVPIITQQVKTTVMVENGGTIVIGGIYQVENTSTKDGVPFFSRLPILGSLFKRSSSRNDQRELLVFITPRIVK